MAPTLEMSVGLSKGRKVTKQTLKPKAARRKGHLNKRVKCPFLLAALGFRVCLVTLRPLLRPTDISSVGAIVNLMLLNAQKNFNRAFKSIRFTMAPTLEM